MSIAGENYNVGRIRETINFDFHVSNRLSTKQGFTSQSQCFLSFLTLRYKDIKEIYHKKFGSNPDFFARAPGRVSLIGKM